MLVSPDIRDEPVSLFWSVTAALVGLILFVWAFRNRMK